MVFLLTLTCAQNKPIRGFPARKQAPTIKPSLFLSEKDPAPSDPAEEETWRKRLAAAELAFREASLAFDAAGEKQPADAQEIAAARERKAQARLEYLRILRIFTDLVLRGKLPG